MICDHVHLDVVLKALDLKTLAIKERFDTVLVSVGSGTGDVIHTLTKPCIHNTNVIIVARTSKQMFAQNVFPISNNDAISSSNFFMPNLARSGQKVTLVY